MHPWKQIIRGETVEEETMRCFMCLEYIPSSDGDTKKLLEHITTVHCAECHVEKLAEMCGEEEARHGTVEMYIPGMVCRKGSVN